MEDKRSQEKKIPEKNETQVTPKGTRRSAGDAMNCGTPNQPSPPKKPFLEEPDSVTSPSTNSDSNVDDKKIDSSDSKVKEQILNAIDRLFETSDDSDDDDSSDCFEKLFSRLPDKNLLSEENDDTCHTDEDSIDTVMFNPEALLELKNAVLETHKTSPSTDKFWKLLIKSTPASDTEIKPEESTDGESKAAVSESDSAKMSKN